MIDIHSHILNNIDDGCKSIEESLKILKNMSNNGVTDIILTPHYIVDSIYQNTIEKKELLYAKLQEEIRKRNININLYLGNEIYIDKNIIKYIGKEALTLNKTNYILLELPISGIYENSYDIILELINNGYKVILAHPERYLTVQKDIKILNSYRDIGVLFQCNIGSLYGMYGRKAKKTFKKLLNKGYINYFASDIHNNNYNYSYIANIMKKHKKYFEKSNLNDIIKKN